MTAGTAARLTSSRTAPLVGTENLTFFGDQGRRILRLYHLYRLTIGLALVLLISRMTALPTITGPVRDAVEGFAETFIREVVSTRRGDIIRLIVSEGPRFPAIADFYFREVVSKGLTGMKALVQLAITRGEIKQRELGEFPQLVVAPAIVAVIWQSLFARHAPLDGLAMFKVHLDLIFGERRKT